MIFNTTSGGTNLWWNAYYFCSMVLSCFKLKFECLLARFIFSILPQVLLLRLVIPYIICSFPKVLESFTSAPHVLAFPADLLAHFPYSLSHIGFLLGLCKPHDRSSAVPINVQLTLLVTPFFPFNAVLLQISTQLFLLSSHLPAKAKSPS